MSDTPLLDQVLAMRQRGEVRCDLHKAAQAGQAMGKLQQELWAPLAKSLGTQMAAEIATPSGMKWWAPLAKPLAALGVSAGLFGASRIYQSAQAAGVETEVVKRFKDEFLLGGRRSEEDWAGSGIELKVRKAYRDLKQIAPDVAAKAPAALGAVRPVALRESPNFSSEEVRTLAEAQQKMRDTQPAGGTALRAVETIFKMTPDMPGV